MTILLPRDKIVGCDGGDEFTVTFTFGVACSVRDQTKLATHPRSDHPRRILSAQIAPALTCPRLNAMIDGRM